MHTHTHTHTHTHYSGCLFLQAFGTVSKIYVHNSSVHCDEYIIALMPPLQIIYQQRILFPLFLVAHKCVCVCVCVCVCMGYMCVFEGGDAHSNDIYALVRGKLEGVLSFHHMGPRD